MKFIKWFVGIAFTLLLLCYIISPYWVLRQIQQAYEHNQPEKISTYIDYPALRSSLKPQIMQQLQDKTGLNTWPSSVQKWGKQVSNGLSEQAVDLIVSPQGLSLLLQGKELKTVLADHYTSQLGSLERLVFGDLQLEQKNKASSAERNVVAKNLQNETKARAYYTHWNRFMVDLPTDSGAVHKVHLQRAGLSWKIVALELAQ